MAINDPGGQTVAQLRQSLAELIGESQALRTDVQEAEKARKRSTLLTTVLLVVMAVPLVILLVLVAQTNSISRQVHDTNEKIVDCTTPGGTCSQQSGRRTGEAIGDIIRAQIFMAECSRLYPGEAGPAFDQKLEKCVYDRLAAFAANRAKTQATPSPALSPVPSR